VANESTPLPAASYVLSVVQGFAHCFRRQATLYWFAVVVVGFITRVDWLGVTSFIRALELDPGCYACLLHFFYSQAWRLGEVLAHWQAWCFASPHRLLVNGRQVMVGDHTYGVKEATRMPGIVTLHQHSETSSKPTYFRGHAWAFLALVQCCQEKVLATPLLGVLDLGAERYGESDPGATMATRMVQRAIALAARLSSPCYLLLDAFFAVGPVFDLARASLTAPQQAPLVHIVPRAKKSIVAYEPVAPCAPKRRGRPRRYGAKLKLYDVYREHHEGFQTGQCCVYDRREPVSYLARTLYWKPIDACLLFVMAVTSRGFIVLMSSDLALTPLQAIELYCRRSSIESLFHVLKNLFGGFGYHFWSSSRKAEPRRPRKNQNQPPALPLAHQHLLRTWEAIERFVNVCAIALGICQAMALRYHAAVWQENNLWLRTFSRTLPSLWLTKTYVAKILLTHIRDVNGPMICKIFQERSRDGAHDRPQAHTRPAFAPPAGAETRSSFIAPQSLESDLQNPGGDTLPGQDGEDSLSHLVEAACGDTKL
jgi:hypothetical protein